MLIVIIIFITLVYLLIKNSAYRSNRKQIYVDKPILESKPVDAKIESFSNEIELLQPVTKSTYSDYYKLGVISNPRQKPMDLPLDSDAYINLPKYYTKPTPSRPFPYIDPSLL